MANRGTFHTIVRANTARTMLQTSYLGKSLKRTQSKPLHKPILEEPKELEVQLYERDWRDRRFVVLILLLFVHISGVASGFCLVPMQTEVEKVKYYIYQCRIENGHKFRRI